MIAKGIKFTMAYSPSMEAEVYAMNGDHVDVIMIPSDGNSWRVRWSLLDMRTKFKQGVYKIKEKEISVGI
jgi:hypothetical protein